MAIARLGRQAKRSYGFCIKMTAVTVLGLCFVFVWSVFSSSSSSVVSQRSTFSDIAEPASAHWKGRDPEIHNSKKAPRKDQVHKEHKKGKVQSNLDHRDKKKVNGSSPVSSGYASKGGKHPNSEKKEGVKSGLPKKDGEMNHGEVGSEDKELQKEEGEPEEEAEAVDKDEEAGDGEGKPNQEFEGDAELLSRDGMDQEDKEKVDDDSDDSTQNRKKKKSIGPLFDPKAEYAWKLCSTRSKHNYIPCIDIESAIKRLLSYRHHERSCPKTLPMCLVPLPQGGYDTPVRWPESKLKILYKNVGHPKLAAFVKSQRWVVESGEYLTFPQNQSDVNGGFMHYLEFIEEMVPDIEWGKNIRIVMDIGCLDSNFAATLLDKDVLTLTLGLKDDLVDLAQVALERGFPAVVSPLGNRRVPFPSGVFDAIHCRECHVQWHTNGGKLLLEMNRILRPGGYFILSTKHDSIEVEEAMSKLTASICWNILAHKTDDITEVGVKIYQKPESNDIYGLRRKKNPPLCKENENADAAWYTAIGNCLHRIPSEVEQRGTEWPEEWPKRLQSFPDWISNKEKLIAETERWEAIVNKTYLTGMGIDWSNVRNVMDMKAINGGFAAALSQHKVWVMNVVPVHAPDTLPVIYERGLAGVYHDWCESFGTYPRSYDLLHADHLFSRLKNRCKQPLAIVVEMDRVLRPGGWVIIREKVEILDALEVIFRSLHWEIRMTFHQDKEGIMSVQKTIWRP